MWDENHVLRLDEKPPRFSVRKVRTEETDMSNQETFDEWLLTLAACGVFTGFFPVTAVCAPLWAIRKGSTPTIKAISATGKGIESVISKSKNLIPDKKVPESLPTSKNEYAERAKQKYEQSLELIDSMPLEESEKGSMKIYAKRQLIDQMWELFKT